MLDLNGDNINFWMTSYDSYGNFVMFWEDKLSIEEIFIIVEKIIDLQFKFEICMVDDSFSHNDYIEHLQHCWKSKGLIQPFSLIDYKFYSSDFSYPLTKMFFYEEKKVVEKTISEFINLNGICEYSALVEEFGRKYFELKSKNTFGCGVNLPPIFLKGKLVKNKNNCSYDFSILFQLKSNIWFSTVRNYEYMDDPEGEILRIPEKDNFELAFANTPRLNSFIREMKKICDDYDGEWFSELPGVKSSDLFIPIDGDIVFSEDFE